MKAITKALIAAGVLSLGTQAQAAINPDNSLNPTTGTGAGELFLSVVDRGGPVQRSYILDLGIAANDFMANEASYLNNISISADANLQDMITNAQGNLYWNLAASHNFWDEAGGTYEGLGYLTTSPQIITNNAEFDAGFAQLNSSFLRLGTYLQSANGVSTDYAVNESKIFSSLDNAFYDTAFGDVWNGNYSSETGIGSSLLFYNVELTQPFDDHGMVQLLSGIWNLSTEGTLTYTGAGAPVPVPAAVWLLGSALIGLVGVARRKSEMEGGLTA